MVRPPAGAGSGLPAVAGADRGEGVSYTLSNDDLHFVAGVIAKLLLDPERTWPILRQTPVLVEAVEEYARQAGLVFPPPGRVRSG